jgi:hypothetical protein
VSYNWLSILSIIPWIVVPIIGFVLRHWIVAVISRGVQHQFDREIEQLRTELRKAEEEHKSQLRSKEDDIAALRNIVLSGSAGRQTLLDQRRFEAVERIWTAVNDLSRLKALSATMAILDYSAMVRKASDPGMQQFLSIVGKTLPEGDQFQQLKNVARDEQPFTTEVAWAYFNAYKMILYMNHARFMMLKNAASPELDVEKFFSTEGLRKILKAALPHQHQFIDENDAGAFHYLLDELEACLLAELRKILDGEAADQRMAERARAMMDAMREADREAAQKQAKEGISLKVDAFVVPARSTNSRV